MTCPTLKLYTHILISLKNSSDIISIGPIHHSSTRDRDVTERKCHLYNFTNVNLHKYFTTPSEGLSHPESLQTLVKAMVNFMDGWFTQAINVIILHWDDKDCERIISAGLFMFME